MREPIDWCTHTAHTGYMTTKTFTVPAIGTCPWAGHTVRVAEKPAAPFTECPMCEPIDMGTWIQRSWIKWAKVAAKVTETECDSACTSAKGHKCSCACGGERHGIAWEVR